MRALLTVVLKDLKVFVSDRNGALMTVVVPVALAALLGMLFAPRSKAGTIGVLVADQDGGPRVAALIDELDASEAIEVERTTEEDATGRVKAGKASVALVIPAGSSERLRPANLFTGEQGTVALLFDPSRQVEASLAEGLLMKVQMEQAASGFTDPAELKSMFGELRRTLSAADAGSEWLDVMDRAIRAADEPAGVTGGSGAPGGGMRPPLAIARQELTAAASGYNSYAHTFSGMLCMFLLFMAQDMAKNLAQERSQGSLVRLRVSLARPWQVLAGMALATAVIALAISAAVYGAGMAVFGIRVLGSWPGFVVVLLAQALFAGAFALLLCGVARTEKLIASVGSAVILAFSFLGGAWFPRFLMPDWLQGVGKAIPTAWATDGLAAMTWRGLPVADGLADAAVLLAFAAVAGGIGVWRFRWEQ